MLKVKVVDTTSACEQAINDFKSHYEEFPVLGYNCELVSSGTKGKQVALLRLAAIDEECILIKLSMLDTIPQNLVDLLQNKNILKVGIVPLDAQRVLDAYNITVGAVVDLQLFAREMDPNSGGLEDLTKQQYLYVTLDKNWRNATNWDNICLPSYKVKCAATEVQVAVKIFLNLKSSLWPSDLLTVIRYCEQLNHRYLEERKEE